MIKLFMEKRRSKRIIVTLEAELVLNDTAYKGFVENLSEDGIYVVTSPTKTNVNFNPGDVIGLKFRLPSGEILDMHCKVVWSYKTPPHGLTNSIGMEIINPPQNYMESLEAFH